MASRFHSAIAKATVSACDSLARAADTELVALAGGVFQNRRLLEAVASGLGRTGLRVLVAGAAAHRRWRDLVRPDGGRRPGNGVSELEPILCAPVFINGANRPFGELTPRGGARSGRRAPRRHRVGADRPGGPGGPRVAGALNGDGTRRRGHCRRSRCLAARAASPAALGGAAGLGSHRRFPPARSA